MKLFALWGVERMEEEEGRKGFEGRRRGQEVQEDPSF